MDDVHSAVWSLYLLRCADGSIYTGISTNVTRRVREHADGGRGAKSLRGRGPLELVYCREIGDRSLASRIEYRIRRLPRAEKADPASLSGRVDAMLSGAAAAH